MSKIKKRVTIKDVAELAEVSIATVSRVLNNPDYKVSAAVQQRVKDAVEKLGYVPNLAAQALRNDDRQYRDIGVAIPNVTNQFYLQTLMGIDTVLSENKCNIILCNTMSDVKREHDFLYELYHRRTLGVILSSVDEDPDVINKYIKKGMKFVLLDQKVSDVDCPCISYDSRAGARMAIEYLIRQGHRKIAFATMPLTRWTRHQIHKGYREAMIESGRGYNENLVYTAEVQESDFQHVGEEVSVGRRIAEKFLKDGCPATAIFCNNDMLAIGLMQVLIKNGVNIPDDVSIIGFDDIPFAEAFYPALTTIRYPSVETGRLAAIIMLGYISKNKNFMTMDMHLTPRLVVRDTVKQIIS
ncbi:MAG: LacI family transcriptional regulator [Clostridiaceae bacterium]|nr:LacI family transcriptional regulator [Clostridiaceae bacterium]